MNEKMWPQNWSAPFRVMPRLRFTQTKNRVKAPVMVDIPIVLPLRAALDATPANGLTYLQTASGRPFTAAWDSRPTAPAMPEAVSG
jgi:hypothetical protein